MQWVRSFDVERVILGKSSVTGRNVVKYEPYIGQGIYGVVGILLYAIDLVVFGVWGIVGELLFYAGFCVAWFGNFLQKFRIFQLTFRVVCGKVSASTARYDI